MADFPILIASPDDDIVVVDNAFARYRRTVDERKGGAVDGLRLTIPGEELRRLLEQRIQDHQRYADRWRREQERTPEQQTEEEPLLPDHMCANEAERHAWRADVLEFIRDHVDASEVYLLSEADLAFAELLPEKPGSLEQAEYEERTAVGFHLERLTRRIGGFMPTGFGTAAPQPEDEDPGSS